MTRRIKKFFAQYPIDFWIFILSIITLAAVMYYLNNEAGMSETRVISGISESIEAASGLATDLELKDARNANIYIFILTLTVIFCCFLIQKNKKSNSSPFEWFSLKVSKKFSSGFSSIQLNNYQANILMLAAMLVVFVLYASYQFVSGQRPMILIVHLSVITLVLATLYFSVRRGISEHTTYLLICLSMTMPLIFHAVFGGFTDYRLPDTYVWVIVALTFSMFVLNRKYSQLFFKMFGIVLFIEIICEIKFSKGVEIVNLIEYVSNIFYAGFVIFASLEIYMTRSIKNYSVLEDVYEELKGTQTQLIQREKMVTLGQLIAGVAHEINTPIGAIKASAEILEELDIGRIIKTTRGFTDDDIDAMIIILEMCSLSIKNMRSSMELRRGKVRLRKYLETIDIPNVDEISNLLARMEICDIEKVDNNMDLFRRENIVGILKSVCLLLPFLNSVQSVKFASDKITKIVFALKSFSHISTISEEAEFDVVKNIENVLVLYQNQLKGGIEIVKQYDDDIPYAYGSADEISQVWTNITQNAIHAMSSVGRLIIKIRNISNEKVEVSFTDSGPGISPENINNLFLPFFTTKPLGEGSGLGLDICKKVLLKNKGDIQVFSKLGQGATFTVTLPAAASVMIKKAAGMEGGV